MAKAKLAITFDEQTLAEVDQLVKLHMFPNRSRVIEQAVVEKLGRLNHILILTSKRLSQLRGFVKVLCQ